MSVWAIPANDLSLELPLRERDSDGTELLYNFTVDWGDGTTDEVTSFDDVDKSHTYAEADEYTVVISGLMQGVAMHTTWEDIANAPNPHASKLLRVPNLGDLGYVTLDNAFLGAETCQFSEAGLRAMLSTWRVFSRRRGLYNPI